jgi:ribosomal protein L16 Arg81 hydroxylase
MNQRASQAELLGASQARVAQVIDPVDWEHFCAEYWDRKPLYLADGSDRFASLADAATLRRLVESGTPWQYRRLPEMYIDSGFVPHEDLVHEYVDMDGRVARAPRMDRVRQLLLNGATANCFGQEAHFPELMALKLAFAQAFSAEVETSLFYSQKDHPGLAPHYDCGEIFVLQISGRKRWFVSDQRHVNPIVGYGGPVAYDDKAPHATIELEPGDLLYLPRGTFHHACALTEESLHTSVAIKMPSYLDLLQALAGNAADLDAMRDYLPLGGPAAWADARVELVERLRSATALPAYGAAVQRLLGRRIPAR